MVGGDGRGEGEEREGLQEGGTGAVGGKALDSPRNKYNLRGDIESVVPREVDRVHIPMADEVLAKAKELQLEWISSEHALQEGFFFGLKPLRDALLANEASKKNNVPLSSNTFWESRPSTGSIFYLWKFPGWLINWSLQSPTQQSISRYAQSRYLFMRRLSPTHYSGTIWISRCDWHQADGIALHFCWISPLSLIPGASAHFRGCCRTYRVHARMLSAWIRSSG